MPFKERVDQERPRVAAAQGDIKKWLEELPVLAQ